MKNLAGFPGLLLLCSLILAPLACAPGDRQAEASGPQPSPHLAALQRRIEAGDRDAVPRFWEEVEKTGAPLVEPIPGDDERLLVTFLWRGGWRTRDVAVLGSVANGARMARLPDSDVWFWSTPVRRDARFTYRFASNADREQVRLDPLNRRPFPASDPLLSLVEMPQAPPLPWIARRPGVPQGKVVDEGRIHSAILRGDREMRVYTPAGYRKDGEPYRLLLVFDGLAYTTLIPLPTILDNLIASGEIPPVVAVLVDRLDSDHRESDLSCTGPFPDFLVKEALPWIRQRYHVTTDPAGTVLVGSSRGGLTAACAAMEHPGLFGNVLSQSGSFAWKPEGDPNPQWLTRRVAASPRLPLRFYLDIGLMEIWPTHDGAGPSLLEANRHLRDVLQAKGYEVHYAEYSGGHSYATWAGTISDGLKKLLRPGRTLSERSPSARQES